MGFEQISADAGLYKATDGDAVIIAVYVDDILIATGSDKCMKEVKTGLGQKIYVKDLGQIKSFLLVQVDQDDQNLWIGQPGYTISLLERFGMRSAKPVSTPVDTSIKLK